MKPFLIQGKPMSLYSDYNLGHNLSHEQRESSFAIAKQTRSNKIKERGDLPYVSVQKQLELLDQLSEFGLGRFLIERGGLNGYWTHYVITHPLRGRLSQLNQEGKSFHPLEAFVLNSAPTCVATQQRFALFKSKIQEALFEGCSLASIPSGLMGDLLDLDYSSLSRFTLNGIDLDAETLFQAESYAQERGLSQHCQFSQKDAWHLSVKDEFDLISSNGLTIYEVDDKKVVALYRQFYEALKPGGILVTSFLTPPPIPGTKSEWKLERVNQQDALMQKILFSDVLDVKWQVFRDESTVIDQLKKAGFKSIELLYDDAHIFPTVIVKKPLK